MAIELTVTATGLDTPEQPPVWLTVTEYEPAAVTFIDCVVAPLFHKYDAPADAVSTTLPPVHNDVGPLADTVAVPPEPQVGAAGLSIKAALVVSINLSNSISAFTGVNLMV